MRALLAWTGAAVLVPYIQDMTDLAECGASPSYDAECSTCSSGAGICLTQGAGSAAAATTKKVCVPHQTMLLFDQTSMDAFFSTCAGSNIQFVIDACVGKQLCEEVTVRNTADSPTASVAGVVDGVSVPCWRFNNDGPLIAYGAQDLGMTSDGVTESKKGSKDADNRRSHCLLYSAPGLTPAADLAGECVALCAGAAAGSTCYKNDCDSCDGGTGLCMCEHGECMLETDKRICMTPDVHVRLDAGGLDLVDAQCPANKIKQARAVCDNQPWCTEVTPTADVIANILNQKVLCRKYASDGDMIASQDIGFSRSECLMEAPVPYVQASVDNDECATTCELDASGVGPCYKDKCLPCGSDGNGVCVCKEGGCTSETDKTVCMHHSVQILLDSNNLDAVDSQCPDNKLNAARIQCEGKTACDSVDVSETARVIPEIQGQTVLCRQYNGGLMLSQDVDYSEEMCNANSPIAFVTAAATKGDLTSAGCVNGDGTYKNDCDSCGSYSICVCKSGTCTTSADERVCLTKDMHFKMDQDSIDKVNQQCPSNVHRQHFTECTGRQPCERIENPQSAVMSEVKARPTYCGYHSNQVTTPAPTPGTQTFQEVLHLLDQPATVSGYDYAGCVAKMGYTEVPAADYTDDADKTMCKKARCTDRGLDDATNCYEDNCTPCGDKGVGVCTCRLGLCTTELDERVCTTKAKYTSEAVCKDTWTTPGEGLADQGAGLTQVPAFASIDNQDCVGLETCDQCSLGVQVSYGGRCVWNSAAKKNVCLDTYSMGQSMGTYWAAISEQCPAFAGMEHFCATVDKCKQWTYLNQNCFCTLYDNKPMCSFEVEAMQAKQCAAVTRAQWWAFAPALGLALLFAF